MKRYLIAIIFAGLALAVQPTTVRAQTGNSQASPLFPTSISGSTFTFTNEPNTKWFSPSISILAPQFDYHIPAPNLFTKIEDFPTSFNSPFTVKVGATTIGNFLPGQSVDFQALLGSGVSDFSINGINPSVSSIDFPVKLSFVGPLPTANFTITQVGGSTAAPEPGTLLLIGLGIGASKFCKRRNNKA
jgi:PEP-CTERM motif